MTEPLQRSFAVPSPAHAPGAMLHTDCELVGVLVTHDWRRLVALSPIPAGRRIFVINGRETPTPTRYSVQVGMGLHLDQDHAHDITEVVRRYCWRYMDHDCDPTTVVRNRSVVARRDIDAGEGITFNYNTTEYVLAEPFNCKCGSALCMGTVRGAKYLTDAQRVLLDEWLADYLR
jgi:hypothetical protein